MSGPRLLPLALAALLLAACHDSTGPARIAYTLPSPDESLDTTHLAADPLLWACGGWDVHTPTERVLLLDLQFLPTTQEPLDGPSQADMNAVRATGGVVLHEFHFPAVRAAVYPSAILQLARSARLWAAYGVPDPRRFDWPVDVAYAQPVTDADMGRLAELGGRVIYRGTNPSGVTALLPDRSLPALRAEPRVATVDPQSVFCAALARPR